MNPPIQRVSLARTCLLLLLAAVGFSSATLAAESPALTGVVNVNTASSEELQMLPGIGEARARAIVDARKARGGFKTVDDLIAVHGIGERALERLRPFVALQGKTTAQVR